MKNILGALCAIVVISSSLQAEEQPKVYTFEISNKYGNSEKIEKYTVEISQRPFRFFGYMASAGSEHFDSVAQARVEYITITSPHEVTQQTIPNGKATLFTVVNTSLLDGEMISWNSYFNEITFEDQNLENQDNLGLWATFAKEIIETKIGGYVDLEHRPNFEAQIAQVNEIRKVMQSKNKQQSDC